VATLKDKSFNMQAPWTCEQVYKLTYRGIWTRAIDIPGGSLETGRTIYRTYKLPCADQYAIVMFGRRSYEELSEFFSKFKYDSHPKDFHWADCVLAWGILDEKSFKEVNGRLYELADAYELDTDRHNCLLLSAFNNACIWNSYVGLIPERIEAPNCDLENDLEELQSIAAEVGAKVKLGGLISCDTFYATLPHGGLSIGDFVGVMKSLLALMPPPVVDTITGDLSEIEIRLELLRQEHFHAGLIAPDVRYELTAHAARSSDQLAVAYYYDRRLATHRRGPLVDVAGMTENEAKLAAETALFDAYDHEPAHEAISYQNLKKLRMLRNAVLASTQQLEVSYSGNNELPFLILRGDGSPQVSVDLDSALAILKTT
jgi:hypothetical protein